MCYPLLENYWRVFLRKFKRIIKEKHVILYKKSIKGKKGPRWELFFSTWRQPHVREESWQPWEGSHQEKVSIWCLLVSSWTRSVYRSKPCISTDRHIAGNEMKKVSQSLHLRNFRIKVYEIIIHYLIFKLTILHIQLCYQFKKKIVI